MNRSLAGGNVVFLLWGHFVPSCAIRPGGELGPDDQKTLGDLDYAGFPWRRPPMHGSSIFWATAVSGGTPGRLCLLWPSEVLKRVPGSLRS